MKAFNYLFSDVEKIAELKEKSVALRKSFGQSAFGHRLEYITRYLTGEKSEYVFLIFFAALLHKSKRICHIKTFGFDELALRNGKILDLNKYKNNFNTSQLDAEGKYLLKILDGFPVSVCDINLDLPAYVSTIMNGFDAVPITEDVESQTLISDLQKGLERSGN